MAKIFMSCFATNKNFIYFKKEAKKIVFIANLVRNKYFCSKSCSIYISLITVILESLREITRDFAEHLENICYF